MCINLTVSSNFLNLQTWMAKYFLSCPCKSGVDFAFRWLTDKICKLYIFSPPISVYKYGMKTYSMVVLAVSAQSKALLIRQQESEWKLEIFYIKHEYSVLFFLAMDVF